MWTEKCMMCRTLETHTSQQWPKVITDSLTGMQVEERGGMTLTKAVLQWTNLAFRGNCEGLEKLISQATMSMAKRGPDLTSSKINNYRNGFSRNNRVYLVSTQTFHQRLCVLHRYLWLGSRRVSIRCKEGIAWVWLFYWRFGSSLGSISGKRRRVCELSHGL